MAEIADLLAQFFEHFLRVWEGMGQSLSRIADAVEKEGDRLPWNNRSDR